MLPERSAFLSDFRLRNRGLIADDDQRRLAEARIAVAGCGSTGGAVVEPLVRAGAMHLALYEPGTYEINNLNRQRATVAAIGRNKAEWLAERARDINPYVEISVEQSGVTRDNVAALCAGADLIVDAVDVTSMSGLAAKLALHEAAARAGRTVVTAYDLAYRQYIRVFRYADDPRPFGGALPALQRAMQPMDSLALLVPVKAIPPELVDEIERLRAEPGASISQLGCTSDLFGAMIVPLAIDLLARRAVRSEITIDLRDAMRSARSRLGARVATLARLLRIRARMRASS